MEKNKKIIIIIVVITLVLLSTFIYLLNNKKYNYSKLLENQNYDIVYNKENTGNDKVPYVNLTGDSIKKINQEIASLYEYYLIFSPDGFDYNYSVSDSILSIIITAHIIQPESDNYNILYKSYNIELKKLKLLTDDEILKRFKITNKDMEYYLYNKYLNMYYDLIDKKYFTEEQYSFKTFLENKNLNNLLEDNNYYINNNHLEIYKYFNNISEYGEEKYFDEKSFHFIVT